MTDSFKHLSRYITDGPDRAPARAMLKAVGFTNEDLARPLVGVAHSWIEVMPCTLNARDLAEHVKAGIRAAGGTPIEYNTIAVSDGVSMGTEGMKASLISRELIADSIELVARGHLFDAVVAISGCDKTIPAAVMGLARLNIPSLMLYGGSIMPGRFQGRDVTIQDVFEGVGAYAAGKMTAARYLPDGQRRRASDRSVQERCGVPLWAIGHGIVATGPASEPDHHPASDGECDCLSDGHRRLDQCGAASAGGGAGGRRAVDY
jgi:dihydroxyacid dehydratase/phosphogluconate dehydratase